MHPSIAPLCARHLGGRSAHPIRGRPAVCQSPPPLLAFIGKARIARDHEEEPADARECSNDLLDHAVGEIFLPPVARSCSERHRRQRRLIRQRRHAAHRARLDRSRRARSTASRAPEWSGCSCLRFARVENPAKCGDLHVECCLRRLFPGRTRRYDIRPAKLVFPAALPAHEKMPDTRATRDERARARTSERARNCPVKGKRRARLVGGAPDTAPPVEAEPSRTDRYRSPKVRPRSRSLHCPILKYFRLF